MRWRNALGRALAASLVLHGAVLLSLRGSGLDSTEPPRDGQAVPIWVELSHPTPVVIAEAKRDGSQGRRVFEPELLRDSAPAPARLDTPWAGSGLPAAEAAVNLASRPAHVSVRRETPNHPNYDQVQRLHTNPRRATRDERRATPNPMLLSLLATGEGTVEARRPAGRVRPARGQRGGAPLQARPALDDSPPQVALRPPRRASPAPPRSPSSPQRDERRAAVTQARPDVQQARPAVPALRRARPHDSVDSTHAVAQRIASFIASSTAGGESGSDYGGLAGSAEGVGQGADRWGSQSRHSGVGRGDGVGADPAVSAYLGYVRQSLRRLIGPAFPKTAKAEGRSGVAIFGFVIAAHGGLTQIELKRASGIVAYDGNLSRALHATRLRPPPDGMAPVRLSMRFDAVNPAVAGTSRDAATAPLSAGN